MNISARTEYAALALLELARRSVPQEPVPIREIAEAHGIPSRFLVQILLQLKSAGLVTSTRGASGGYALSVPPQQISLADIRRVIEGASSQPAPCGGTRPSELSRALWEAWQEVWEREQSLLAGISLADLLDRAGGKAQDMYYI